MSQLSKRQKTIIDEASEWVTKLDNGKLLANTQQEFAEWLSMSKEHIQEFLFATATFQALGDIKPPERLTIDQLLAEKAPNVVPLFRAMQVKVSESEISGDTIIDIANQAAGKTFKHSKKQAAWKKLSLIAATIAFPVIFASSYMAYNSGVQNDGTQYLSYAQYLSYSTDVGEQRSISLSDGSVIYLNTDSRVSVRYLETERRIELLKGEALFKVAHNTKRPFKVYSGSTVAEALGTTFNVYRLGDHTNVAVVEGKVAVSTQKTALSIARDDQTTATTLQDATTAVQPLVLASGQKSGLDKDQGFLPVQSVQTDLITSWRERRLVFEQEQLATITREFNRYNRLKLVIEDEDLATIKFDGVFDADDPEAFVQFLRLSGEIEARQVSNLEIRLSKARPEIITDQKI